MHVDLFGFAMGLTDAPMKRVLHYLTVQVVILPCRKKLKVLVQMIIFVVHMLICTAKLHPKQVYGLWFCP